MRNDFVGCPVIVEREERMGETKGEGNERERRKGIRRGMEEVGRRDRERERRKVTEKGRAGERVREKESINVHSDFQ